ncbi:glycosyltransferase [Infirmifilum lucidum]|uniref:Glycosyltransferase n=1 Tax=Infirmifilum lucidum TaxID=2776706 RepID=A0A7L9FII8_9CREN|nr:glycosyltransferase [Infirmifilum lucidum]QOJ79172.1 glycosyltransferase [Infirmifilum lucidum]
MRAQPKYSRRVEDYREIIGDKAYNELIQIASKLEGKRLVHVNSTSYGGGVAEILHSVVPLMRSLGIDAEWQVLEAEQDFFQVTKKIHNALQGNRKLELTEEERRKYLEWNRYNAEILDLDADIVLIHDPQPMAIPFYARKRGRVWVWRCHIDLSSPNEKVYKFVSQFLPLYNGVIVHSEEYVKPEFENRVLISPPSIDPLSDKNKPLEPKLVESIAGKFGVDPAKPVLAKVARFDPWKDVFSAVDVYRIVAKRYPEAQLLLISSMARDDPEGTVFYRKVVEYVAGDRNVFILTDEQGVHDIEVNAFQRITTVGLHTAVKEGFGLAVTEFLWKNVPVVARPVGGVKKQVIENVTGLTGWSPEELSEKVLHLLRNPEDRARLGRAGREHVLENFVITRHTQRYLSFTYSLLS